MIYFSRTVHLFLVDSSRGIDMKQRDRIGSVFLFQYYDTLGFIKFHLAVVKEYKPYHWLASVEYGKEVVNAQEIDDFFLFKITKEEINKTFDEILQEIVLGTRFSETLEAFKRLYKKHHLRVKVFEHIVRKEKDTRHVNARHVMVVFLKDKLASMVTYETTLRRIKEDEKLSEEQRQEYIEKAKKYRKELNRIKN